MKRSSPDPGVAVVAGDVGADLALGVVRAALPDRLVDPAVLRTQPDRGGRPVGPPRTEAHVRAHRAAHTRHHRRDQHVPGEADQTGVEFAVEVEECFLQCAKALIRSKLWDARAAGRKSSLPGFAEILTAQTKIEGQTVESLSRLIEDSYVNHLY